MAGKHVRNKCKNEKGCRDDTVPKTVDASREGVVEDWCILSLLPRRAFLYLGMASSLHPSSVLHLSIPKLASVPGLPRSCTHAYISKCMRYPDSGLRTWKAWV